jgi:hypothetical protein
MPGLVGAFGPDGPLGYATDVRVTDERDARRAQTIPHCARGAMLYVAKKRPKNRL